MSKETKLVLERAADQASASMKEFMLNAFDNEITRQVEAGCYPNVGDFRKALYLVTMQTIYASDIEEG